MFTETFSTGFVVDDSSQVEAEGGPSASFFRRRPPSTASGCVAAARKFRRLATRPRHVAGQQLRAGRPRGAVHRYHKIRRSPTEAKTALPPGHARATRDRGCACQPFVCYDLRFADEFWELAPPPICTSCQRTGPRVGAPLDVAATGAGIENQAYVVGCNRVGEGGGLKYVGDSRIVDPLGELLATGSQHETILFADIEPATVAATRDRFRFLQDRR